MDDEVKNLLLVIYSQLKLYNQSPITARFLVSSSDLVKKIKEGITSEIDAIKWTLCVRLTSQFSHSSNKRHSAGDHFMNEDKQIIFKPVIHLANCNFIDLLRVPRWAIDRQLNGWITVKDHSSAWHGSSPRSPDYATFECSSGYYSQVKCSYLSSTWYRSILYPDALARTNFNLEMLNVKATISKGRTIGYFAVSTSNSVKHIWQAEKWLCFDRGLFDLSNKSVIVF